MSDNKTRLDFSPTFFPAFLALFLHHHFRLTALAPTGIRIAHFSSTCRQAILQGTTRLLDSNDNKTRLDFSTYLFPCSFWPYFYIIILDSQLLLQRGSEFYVSSTCRQAILHHHFRLTALALTGIRTASLDFGRFS